ncbi:hypothetical protein JJD41_22390 [Oxynema sp. CENA135]|uniref:hypothetical protein n=1 Tax=Oxynema sp. CENA135 TaxID=984206 RepID=UPI00190C6AFB|nr:hypothetical protein [Oxynema sp. CENA135]MBK4732592.1 hypothetical protein [Oxynema sp. CENA135]
MLRGSFGDWRSRAGAVRPAGDRPWRIGGERATGKVRAVGVVSTEVAAIAPD